MSHASGVVTGRMRDPNGAHDGRTGSSEDTLKEGATHMAKQSSQVGDGLSTAGQVMDVGKGLPYVGTACQVGSIACKGGAAVAKTKATVEAKQAKGLSGGGGDDLTIATTAVAGAVSTGTAVKGAVGGKGDAPKADVKGTDAPKTDLKAEAPKADAPTADVPKPSPAAAQKLELHADASAAGKGKRGGSVLDKPEVRALL